MTPMYTVANCLGKDKNAARANVHTLMPHEAKTAVVTDERDVIMPFSNEKSTHSGLE